MKVSPGLHGRRRHARWARFSNWLIVVLLFVVLIPIVMLAVAYSNQMRQQEARLAAMEAQVRALGQPVTLDELDAFYPQVGPAENSALVYEQAIDLIPKIDPDMCKAREFLRNIEDVEPGMSMPEPWMQSLDLYLEECAPILELVEQASLLDHARFSIDFREGMVKLKLPHLWAVRGCARIVSLKSYHAAHRGAADTVVESHRQMLHLAASLQEEPFLMSQLVQTALHSMEVDALARDLSIHSLPRDLAGSLQILHEDTDIKGGAVRAYLGERCLTVSATKAMTSTGYKNPSFMILERFQLFWLEQELNIYVEMKPLVELDHQTWPQWLEAKSKIGQDAQSLPHRMFVMRTLLPAFARSCEAFAREAALMRMAQTSLAAERYRLDHAALPETLDELVPQYLDTVPEDPFDGAPLRYRRTEPGYLLYSVYTDLKDDGGIPATRDENKQWHGDWVFAVRR